MTPMKSSLSVEMVMLSLFPLSMVDCGTVTLDDNDSNSDIQNLIYNQDNNRLIISNNVNTNVVDLSDLATDDQDLLIPSLDASYFLQLGIEGGNTTSVDLAVNKKAKLKSITLS